MPISMTVSHCCRNRYLEIPAVEGLTKRHVDAAVCNWSKTDEQDTVLALFRKTHRYCRVLKRSLGFCGWGSFLYEHNPATNVEEPFLR